MSKQLGLTQSGGFQVGARKTYSIASTRLWDLLFSEKVLSQWLDTIDVKALESGQHLTTSSGVSIKVRVWNPYSHLRMDWQPEHWTKPALLQVRIIKQSDQRTTLAFHMEKLTTPQQRAEMKDFWKAVLQQLNDAFHHDAGKRT